MSGEGKDPGVGQGSRGKSKIQDIHKTLDETL